ncbi:DUF302 domain-containing protein [Caenispirillum bisanense]|uniref:Uncharacterized conserved protein, DUF302 family n=1 Tax=Caenispirillum bisanense TaxID=414052 RepID=A0A286G9Q6_9PROT|nr:DUF302 domain-containing protein [Caenispirillum bisanense]SOD92235.1 Uncharacterized conserved protein, DUF302 family [Caenispirillum bisanense]
MTYTFTRTLPGIAFDAAVERVTDALKQDGFGVLTEIDVQAVLRQKIGAEVAPYRILGACNPTLAHKALTAEPHIGTMLPCNVVVRETEDGTVEVAAVDPAASMRAVDNPALAAVAGEVGGRLKAIVDGL